MKFSVLMSVYKNEQPKYLEQALESMVTQTLMPDEIVMIKDGLLTEALDKVLVKYQKCYPKLFKIVAFEQNRGLGLALRDGVLACKYDYIARMDTDDVADIRRFEVQMKFLEKNPQVALLGSWSKEFEHDVNKPYASIELPCLNEDILVFARKRNPFRHPTVVFKKDAILTSGNYRDFMWFEDYDVFVRIMLNGYEVANIGEYLVSVRADSNQFARRGGIKYAKQDVLFQIMLYKYGFIGPIRFGINTVIRLLIRILPNNFRTFLYIHFLRRKENGYA